MFLNLSNHPLCTWPESQSQAACSLGFGDPADLDGGMPLIDPCADTEELRALARTIADRACAQGARAAHVGGDPTFSFALVCELQRRGIPCFAPTTRRDAQEQLTPDGARVKTSVFRFVRWRQFPPPNPHRR